MSKVRKAIIADVERIVALGKTLHGQSTYVSKGFSDEKAKSMVAMMVNSETDQAFVAEEDGKVIGYFLGGVTYEWFSDELIAFDYSVYVVPEKRNGRVAIKLFKAFENWATEKGAEYLHVGLSTGINVEGNSRFYCSLGFKENGVLFEKRL